MDPLVSRESDFELPTIDLASTKITSEVAAKCLQDEYLYKSTENTRKTPQESLNRSSESLSRSFKKPRRPSEPFSVPLVRNFEKILKKTESSIKTSPSVLPSRPKKPKPDVFSKAGEIEANSGPLSHLKQRLNKVVKVVVRRRRKVSFISRVIEYKGILTIFDKHMNLHLKDVIETFRYQRDNKIMRRGRHRNGIILRGDNIILLA